MKDNVPFLHQPYQSCKFDLACVFPLWHGNYLSTVGIIWFNIVKLLAILGDQKIIKQEKYGPVHH